jgi:GxxExxY protein
MEKKIVLPEESYNIVGAAIEVHKIIGCGFSEAIYQEALEKELQLRNIPYSREKIYYVTYKDQILSKHFRPDLVCYDKVIVELKALPEITDEHVAQVLNYLKASGLRLGIIINFGTETLEYKRILPNPKWKLKE